MIFEAFLGNQWMAWRDSETVKISKKGNVVTVITQPEEAKNNADGTFRSPAHDKLTTKFDLTLIPAYTFG